MNVISPKTIQGIYLFGLPHHFKELAQFLTVCLDWECKGR